MQGDQIHVTSHVARDFLQNAAYFNSAHKVAWEYISNSIDNPKPDEQINVIVQIAGLVPGSIKMTIADDGVGMSREDLKRFFKMHAVNVQRKQGKQVRGRFGTGKCAAFGIARKLEIETNHKGKKNSVSLTYKDILGAQDGKPFPVKSIVIDKEVEESDGTVVVISDLKIPNIDVSKIISYIEKHLARYRSRVRVIINDYVCKFKEPPAVLVRERRPPDDVRAVIGDVNLIIKVSPIPLSKEENGVDILSNGIWHETTIAHLSGDYVNRLFGEVDVPLFEEEEDEAEIPAFDNTRNNMMNRMNPKVVVLLGWISDELELVRNEIAEQERIKKRTQERRILNDCASKLAKILNDDFEEMIEELEIARRAVGRRTKYIREEISESGILLPGNGDQEVGLVEAGQPHGQGEKGEGNVGAGEIERPGPSLQQGRSVGSPQRRDSEGKRRTRGIFTIEFIHLTEDERRSKYDPDTRTIYINLDHPQVRAAFKMAGENVESQGFLFSAYEIACVEYALALQYERMESEIELDVADSLFSISETIDRVGKRLGVIFQDTI